MPPPRTGTVVPLPSGRFRVLQRLPDGTRKTVGICDTEEEAEVLRLSSLRVLEKEAPDGTNTLRAYGARWLKARTSRDSAGDESRWLLHIDTDPLARMTIRSIQRYHVEDWLERMWAKKVERKGTPIASQTIRNVLNLLRKCLDHAYRRRLAKHNAALGVRVGSRARTDDEWHYLRPDEQRSLIAAAPKAERAMLVFAMTSGLRAGELVALRIADVHEDHIVVRYGGAPDHPTKGGRVRTVYLSKSSRDALDMWLANLPKYTATARHPNGHNPLGLVFPRRRGSFRDENHILRWIVWKATLASAKLARRFRWHDLRHTCGTSLACGWWGRVWSLQEIQAHLGHAQVSTTERYAKIAAEEIRKAAAKTTRGPKSGGRIGSRSDHGPRSAARKPQKKVPPGRYDRPTFGLGNRRDTSETTAEVGRNDPMETNALALLLAVAHGREQEALQRAAQLAPGRTLREVLAMAEGILRSTKGRRVS